MAPIALHRRDLLLGMVSTTGLFLAGCTTVPRPAAVPAARVDVPADVRAAYGALPFERFPVRASQIELVPQKYWRQQVDDPTGEPAGAVVIVTADRFLYHVMKDGTATRYGIGIGRAGFLWSGRAHIAYKREWPRWTPPSEMIEREPELERYRHGMEPGPENPLGPRALYIHQGQTDTLYRIHGNPDERSIGQAVSSGCVRLLPQDIIHLHNAVQSGSPLIVT